MKNTAGERVLKFLRIKPWAIVVAVLMVLLGSTMVYERKSHEIRFLLEPNWFEGNQTIEADLPFSGEIDVTILTYPDPASNQKHWFPRFTLEVFDRVNQQSVLAQPVQNGNYRLVTLAPQQLRLGFRYQKDFAYESDLGVRDGIEAYPKSELRLHLAKVPESYRTASLLLMILLGVGFLALIASVFKKLLSEK